MDKNRDPEQVNTKQELHRDMERTRQSLSETVDEIKGEITNSLDWQTYLRRYPGACLIGGGALGFIIGRAITGSGYPRNVRYVQDQPVVWDRDSGRAPKLTPEDSSIRRVIDMTASALLAHVVPIVSSKLRDLFGMHAVESSGNDSSPKGL